MGASMNEVSAVLNQTAWLWDSDAQAFADEVWKQFTERDHNKGDKHS